MRGKILASLAVPVILAALTANAGPLEDTERLLRRAHDQFGFETNIDHEYGHNHLHLQLWDHREGPFARWRTDIGFEGEVRATISYIDGTGTQRVRRFSTIPGEGFEAFTEGPVHSPFIYEGVMFAVPDDFGGVSATVDFWVALDDIPTDCPEITEDGPCGGAVEGYFNQFNVLGIFNAGGSDDDDLRSESVILL
jgi:hypothetical protein